MAPWLGGLFVHLLAVAVVASDGENVGGYTRVFSFGDSLTDTGNAAILLAGRGVADRPPYGETYFHRPTGRASDGRLIVDFIAEALGMPHLTPYLAGKVAADFRHGANFAVSGARALEPEFFTSRGLQVFLPISLSTEMSWFNKTLELLASTSQEQREIMASSLVLVGEIGGNDYIIALGQNRTVDEVKTYVPIIIGVIRSVMTDIIVAGAKTVVVPGMLPLGCEPHFLTLFRGGSLSDYDQKSGCIKQLNELAKQHNRALNLMLCDLREIHPDTVIIYADYYQAITDITISPHKYGFGDTPLVACCGSGGGIYNINLTVICGTAGSTVCGNPSKYVSWDGIHYTEAAHRIIACGILEGPYANPPILSN